MQSSDLWIILIAVLAAMLLWKRRRKRSPAKAAAQPDLLDVPLFWWTERDVFSIRDLLRSVAIFGAAGSGKTSGSGFQLAKNIVANRKIGGLILASKPEDREFWERIFANAGRREDLLIFDPASPLRFNFIDEVVKNGGDSRDITQCILTIGETLRHGKNGGGTNDGFWVGQKERAIYNAAEIVRKATGKVTAPDLQKFIVGGAHCIEDLNSEQWRKGFHNQCLGDAFVAPKTAIEAHDYHLASDMWLGEWPVMDEKLRGSILADVVGGVFHVFNTGVVRELVSSTTNISPSVMDEGKWILVDMRSFWAVSSI
jgi:hypothetical protein